VSYLKRISQAVDHISLDAVTIQNKISFYAYRCTLSTGEDADILFRNSGLPMCKSQVVFLLGFHNLLLRRVFFLWPHAVMLPFHPRSIEKNGPGVLYGCGKGPYVFHFRDPISGITEKLSTGNEARRKPTEILSGRPSSNRKVAY
jgi:hypothetical protein